MTSATLGKSELQCSRLAYGCWRICGTWNPGDITPASEAAGRQAVLSAYESGYTLFDHADIYCDGRAETLFGQVLRDTPGMRDRVAICSKCGIVKPTAEDPKMFYRYDSSRAHIVLSCEQSLHRLGIDTLDLYLIHRPDYLQDPEEIAAAFDELRQAGKVRYFGVSNFRPSQLAALQAACPMMPLVANQVELSLACQAPLEDGTVDQCLAQKIAPLAWSPLAGGQLAEGASRVLPAQEEYQTGPVVAELDRIAAQLGCTRSTLALAWLLRHPAGVVPIIGSTNPHRIRQAVEATQVELSREDWYRLLVAARGKRLP